MIPHDPQLERQAPTAYTRTTEDRAETGRNKTRHLARLDDMDEYEIADGEPDIRGWEVRSVDGRRIGTVNGLLVDTEAMMVRYVELELNQELAVDDDHRHAILPIGTARLDDEKDEMVVSLQADVLRTLPSYTRGELTREHEVALMQRLTHSVDMTFATLHHGGIDFYAEPYFNDRLPFAGRRAKSGRPNADGPHIRRS